MISYAEYAKAHAEYTDDRMFDPIAGILNQPPAVPTPWPAVNEITGGGLSGGHVMSISSGDHRFASSLIRDQVSLLRAHGFPVPMLSCHRDRTSSSDLLDWLQSAANDGHLVAAIDWFPNLRPDQEAPTEEEPDPESASEWQPPETDTVQDTAVRITSIAKHHRMVVFLGACMQAKSRALASSPEVRHCLLRGGGFVEGVVRSSLICWPHEGDSSRPAGWFARLPDHQPYDIPPFFLHPDSGPRAVTCRGCHWPLGDGDGRDGYHRACVPGD